MRVEFPLIRGALEALAIATVAVAGLTFIQHGNLSYVVAGLIAGTVLYVVTELAIPNEGKSGEADDLEDPHEADEAQGKEGQHGHAQAPDAK